MKVRVAAIRRANCRMVAASMPQMPIHYYDCAGCNTCWKFGTKLNPDPIRQILKG